MIDYCLKFKDQAEAEDVLTNLGFLTEVEDESGSVVLVSTGLVSIDFVGVIHKPTGKMLKDEDGNEYPAFAAIDGYHVNVRAGEEIPVLDTYKIEPKTPSRVWA
jgi:hypothetical protein